MTKKIIATSVAMGAMLTLIGCGGGSSSTATTSVATGTAYYIDSAVEGVDYTCGARSSVTGADGSFTFEVGESCTFYLGDIELRGVDAAVLVDGARVYETDIKIARILQSLDTDGDISKSITISSAIVKALAAEGISKLPATAGEMDFMLAVIATAGGTVVSESDAAEHMLNTLLVGTTIYHKCGESVDSTTFQENGELSSVEDGQDVTVTYRIEGNIVYTEEEYGEDAHTFVEATADYIKFDEGNGEITTFYFTRESAEASPAMDCGEEEAEEENPLPVVP